MLVSISCLSACETQLSHTAEEGSSLQMSLCKMCFYALSLVSNAYCLFLFSQCAESDVLEETRGGMFLVSGFVLMCLGSESFTDLSKVNGEHV